jgi:hypothetical protein
MPLNLQVLNKGFGGEWDNQAILRVVHAALEIEPPWLRKSSWMGNPRH